MVLVHVAIAPLFMLFVFAKVLSAINYVTDDYGRVMLPGIVALSTFLTALSSVSFPLAMEFGITKEIEDRLLAPLPTSLVAVEKIVAAALRGVVAAVIIYPVGLLVLGSAPWRTDGLPLLAAVLVLGAWAGAAVGITIGTFTPVAKSGLVSALLMTPLIFTGATQYPWPSLNVLPWFQVVTALNPMTYCAEGIRAALVPEVPHLPPLISVAALLASCVVFTVTGAIGFHRRAVA